MERFWRTLDQQLRKSSNTYTDIVELLKPATFALNSTIHSTTGYSPIYLLMGIHPQTGTLFSAFPPTPADVEERDTENIIENERLRKEAFIEVHKRIRNRKEYNKLYHDAMGTQEQRGVGDQILLKNHSVPTLMPTRKWYRNGYQQHMVCPTKS